MTLNYLYCNQPQGGNQDTFTSLPGKPSRRPLDSGVDTTSIET